MSEGDCTSAECSVCKRMGLFGPCARCSSANALLPGDLSFPSFPDEALRVASSAAGPLVSVVAAGINADDAASCAEHSRSDAENSCRDCEYSQSAALHLDAVQPAREKLAENSSSRLGKPRSKRGKQAKLEPLPPEQWCQQLSEADHVKLSKTYQRLANVPWFWYHRNVRWGNRIGSRVHVVVKGVERQCHIRLEPGGSAVFAAPSEDPTSATCEWLELETLSARFNATSGAWAVYDWSLPLTEQVATHFC